MNQIEEVDSDIVFCEIQERAPDFYSNLKALYCERDRLKGSFPDLAFHIDAIIKQSELFS